jgi:hypothetical protein
MESVGYKSSRHALFELDVMMRGGLKQGGSDAEKESGDDTYRGCEWKKRSAARQVRQYKKAKAARRTVSNAGRQLRERVYRECDERDPAERHVRQDKGKVTWLTMDV